VKKYYTTDLIDLEDGETMVCYNGNDTSLELIQIVNGKLKFIETQGEMRDVWKMRIGLVTQDEALEIEARTVQKNNRRIIYDKLKIEFDRDLVLVDRHAVDNLNVANKELSRNNEQLQLQLEHDQSKP